LRSALARLALLVASLGFTLVVAEGVARWVWHERPRPAETASDLPRFETVRELDRPNVIGVYKDARKTRGRPFPSGKAVVVHLWTGAVIRSNLTFMQGAAALEPPRTRIRPHTPAMALKLERQRAKQGAGSQPCAAQPHSPRPRANSSSARPGRTSPIGSRATVFG